jgi:hypothetical protein
MPPFLQGVYNLHGVNIEKDSLTPNPSPKERGLDKGLEPLLWKGEGEAFTRS